MDRQARIHKKTLKDGTAADDILIWDGDSWEIGDITDLTAILPEGTAAGQMLFWTGTEWAYTETTELIWDDTNKRTGIGTAAPEGTLHVAGTAFPLATFERMLTGETTGSWTTNRFQATTTGNMANNFGPAYVFSIEDVAGTANDIVVMGALRDGGDTSGRFQIRTKNAGTYNTAGFNIDAQNRVGIGTINPSREVHLYKDVNAGTVLAIENPNEGNAAHAGFKLGNDLGIADGAVCVFYGSGHASAANQLYFRNYEGSISFLSKAGTSIGLGQGAAIADADNLVINGDGSAVFKNDTDSTTGFQILDADGGTPVFNVDTVNERVGIINSSPTSELDVTGTATMSRLLAGGVNES